MASWKWPLNLEEAQASTSEGAFPAAAEWQPVLAWVAKGSSGAWAASFLPAIFKGGKEVAWK